MNRALLLLLLGACAPTQISKPRAEHVYQLELVLRAEDTGETTRSALVVDDQTGKELTRFSHLRDLEIRTVFHADGPNLYLEVAFEGGEKKERVHDREPVVIDFDRDGARYQLAVTPKRLR